MKKGVVALLIVGLLLAAGYGIWWWTKPTDAGDMSGPQRPGGGRAGGARGMPMVRITLAKIQPVPVLITSMGNMEAEHSVAIRPQYTGILKEIYFREGQPVKAGQLLFRIDATQMEAQAAQVQALIARDQAQLREAQAQVQRLAPLAAKEYVTRQEYDQARTASSTAAAALQADHAQLHQIQAQLAYTRIRSPIAGRSGSLSVKPGDLVTANAPDPLVNINQIHPILVDFTIPEQRLGEVRRYQAEGPLKIEVLHQSSNTRLGMGEVVFVDNGVNVQNGTVLLKARIPNDQETLWPGQFVSVRLILHVDPQAVTVPESAVQTGQQGSFVYLVQNQRAVMRPVKVARQVDNLMVITEGLKGGEPVILNVPRNLEPGSLVKVLDSPGHGQKGREPGKHHGKGHLHREAAS